MNAREILHGNKTTYFLIVSMFINIAELYCQDKKFEFNISSGYSQSTQSYKNIFDINPWRNNIHNVFFGIRVYYRMSSHFKLSLSALILEKGYKKEYTLVFDDIDSTNRLVQHVEINDRIKYSLSYIEFPLIFYYNVNRWSFGGGLYFSYKLAYSEYVMMHHQNISYSSLNNYTLNQSSLLQLGSKRDDESYPLNLLNSNYDIGFNIEINYQLNKYFTSYLYISRGIREPFNYIQGNYDTGLAKQMIFVLGLNYKLF